MTTTQSIQDLINQKADQKLEAAISRIHHFLNTDCYDLLKSVPVNIGTDEAPNNVALAWLFQDQVIIDKIIAANQDRYRQTETEEFIERVNSIRADVESLLSCNEGY